MHSFICCSLSFVNFYVIQFTDLPNSDNSNHRTVRTANSTFHILKTVLNCRSLIISRESLKIKRPDLDLKKDLKNMSSGLFFTVSLVVLTLKYLLLLAEEEKTGISEVDLSEIENSGQKLESDKLIIIEPIVDTSAKKKRIISFEKTAIQSKIVHAHSFFSSFGKTVGI